MGQNTPKDLSIYTRKSDDSTYRIFRISGKIIEAKHIQMPKSVQSACQDGAVLELYCISRIDNSISDQFQTNSVTGGENPFWVLSSL